MAKTQAELDMIKETFGTVPEGVSADAPIIADAAKEDVVVDVTADTPAADVSATVEISLDGAGATETTVVAEEEVSDEALIKLLQKRGIAASSLEDLKPKADPAAEAEKRENKKITYALENNLISKKEYDSYITDASNTEALVYSNFAKEALEENSELTDAEIREDFEQTYALDSNQETLKYKRGQRLLAQEAEKLIREKHSKYFGIDSHFNEFEKTAAYSAKQAAKIKEQAPAYSKAVEDSIAELSSLNFKVGESTYSIKVPASSFEEIRKAWNDKSVAEKNILSSLSKEEIKGAIEMTLLKGSMGQIISSIVGKELEAKAKGVRNIPIDNTIKNTKNVAPSKKVWSAGEVEYLKQAGLPIPQEAN